MALAQVGGTRYSSLTLAETKAVVTAGPALLFNILGFNSGAAVSYIQFFDALTANVEVGTTTPTFVIPLPIGGGLSDAYTLPESFRVGIVVACTATPTGSGAPGAVAILKLGYVGG